MIEKVLLGILIAASVVLTAALIAWMTVFVMLGVLQRVIAKVVDRWESP